MMAIYDLRFTIDDLRFVIYDLRFAFIHPQKIAGVLCAALLICVSAAGARAQTSKSVAYDRLPAAREGKYPVHIPKYEGVEQLLLLSSRWVIVATTDLAEVVAKINELSHGELLKNVDAWEASEKAGKPNWTAYKAMPKIRDQYMTQAREAVGERKMDSPEFFAIASGDDPAYRSAASPLRATRVLVSLGKGQVRGGPSIHYAHYCYLEMPQPLQTGKTYTISLKNGKKVTFLFDEMRTVSRAIKVNQVGYLPSAGQKRAYLGACLYEFRPMDFSYAKQFSIISAATGQAVYIGEIKLREKNPLFAVPPGKNDDPAKRPPICGEDVYEMDLSPLKDVGEFFISIPGVGRSWTFRHGKDVYGEAFYVACRGLFHQRCGVALEAPYTAWTRPRCHTAPVYECQNIQFGVGAFKVPKEFERFDVVGASTDATRKTENVVGGWHDAADWDRNLMHYADVFDLLTAYELAPRKFTDGQLNIPESGNGIPDILDEAEFGLRVWKTSMDARGGVSGAVETWTHPKIDADIKYAFALRTRWCSLVFASAAAQYALLVKSFSPEKAADYASAAQKAFAFGNDPRNSLGKIDIPAAKDRGRGAKYSIAWEEQDGMIVPYLLQAKLRMFLLTKDKSYLEGVADLAPKMPPLFQWPMTYSDYSVWMPYSIVKGADRDLPQELVDSWRKNYCAAADALCESSEPQPYRQTWPRYKDFHAGWGALVMTNYSRALLAAYALTDEKKYRDAAILNADFMLGANPMGMSLTSGLGYVYPVNFQHAISENDGIADPVPGITVYGLTGGPIYADFRNTVWQSPAADGKAKVDFIKPANKEVPFFRRWMCHPMLNTGQCEFTIHETMASTIFTCAMLMDDGWTPGNDLKRRNPRREELLFGYWYLP
ncbi:MAG: glycoside hydrolase family 9 protein [Candidatus Sumerlaeota bacterium]|nr:glycoside hydrolase family 9 protein [Candidatus Sumerlaeota bacterium]